MCLRRVIKVDGNLWKQTFLNQVLASRKSFLDSLHVMANHYKKIVLIYDFNESFRRAWNIWKVKF